MAARSSAQKWIPGWMDGIHFLSRIESVCRPLACEQAGRRDGHQSIQEVLTRFFINLTCYGEGGERAGGDSCGDFMCVCVCVCMSDTTKAFAYECVYTTRKHNKKAITSNRMTYTTPTD
mmetsp:Transcript_46985/g.117169  ORF Transcript_46985/g.117169 Transcript_46985/m.117169 type:complete len:119 (-) Transcript_46985:14-370(-)